MTTFTRIRNKIRLACDACVREVYETKRSYIYRAAYWTEGNSTVCEEHRQEILLKDRRG